MARIAAAEPEREVAIERRLAGLFREIGWIEGGLSELSESAQPLVSRLRPIAEALHTRAYPRPVDGDGAGDGVAVEAPADPPLDPLAAFRAFEA
jgi:hypothetical protein